MFCEVVSFVLFRCCAFKDFKNTKEPVATRPTTSKNNTRHFFCVLFGCHKQADSWFRWNASPGQFDGTNNMKAKKNIIGIDMT